jgi:hypothetical protein
VVLMSCAASVGCAPTDVASAKQKNGPGTQVDTDYVLALSAANSFLEAWRTRDQERGLALLSPRLREANTEDYWRGLISGVSNPHHQAFEIDDGEKLPDGRFAFDVYLYDHYFGETDEVFPRNSPDQIVLTKTGPEDWRVDEVPELW